MSVRPLFTVHCDGTTIGADTDACAGWVCEDAASARDARKVAKLAGWKRKDGKDLCPACWVGWAAIITRIEPC